ncbi:MAG: ferredoxin [Actinomycetota bacterium]|nr:ferredoxin [Actinomycetota bacterium]
MPWIARGLRDGFVTTRYPRRPDDYGEGFRASIALRREALGDAERPTDASEVPDLCPTGAIGVRAGQIRLDRGRCILCGRCVAVRPDLFRFDAAIEIAVDHRDLLVVPAPGEDLDDAALEARRRELATRVRALGRSVHVRHVDCGSDGSEEWEIAALWNPFYDLQRLGVYLTASPRHADLLLVTGAGAAGMHEPLEHAYAAMAQPRVVVAVGTDAASGGLFAMTYATRSGVTHVPIDVYVPGSPPSPFSILHGILLALGLMSRPGRPT